MRTGCTTGKRRYHSYSEALAALTDLEDRGQLRGPFGSVYECSRCGSWHISSRKFTIVRRKGRGKSRRRLLEDVG